MAVLVSAGTAQVKAVWGTHPTGENPKVSIAITQLGDSDLPKEGENTVVFGLPQEFIRGTVAGVKNQEPFVQLAVRGPTGKWNVAQGFVRIDSVVAAGEMQWAIPAASIGCGTDIVEVRALVTSSLLPIGSAEEPIVSVRILAYSPSVLISCATFTSARLHVIEIAGRVPTSGSLLHVSELEHVRVRCEDLPQGSHTQIVVEPENNTWRWAMPESTTSCSGGPREITTPVFFGRTLQLKGGRTIELDLGTKFSVYAVATTKTLPVYLEDGISPSDWRQLSGSIRAMSPKVYVTRTVLGDSVRLKINQLGWSNDGRHFVASPVQQVGGSFEAGPRYVGHNRPEFIVLLVRCEDEDTWRVAGTTQMTHSRGQWTIHIARLAPQSRDSGKLAVALAVASTEPFDPSNPVSEEMLARALGVSEEISFLVVR